jgi:DNA polymerase-1
MKKKRLVLIDGHAILHRAYHALPKTLVNRHGQLVNAVYGFIRMLFRVIEDLEPSYLLVAFDRPEPTFRHKVYVGYQVQRPKMDEEMKDQIDLVKEVLGAFSIPIFEKSGYEADDVIGTLVRQASARSKVRSIIVTGDRDIFQLINDSTFVYVPVRGFSQAEMFDKKKAKDSLGIWPRQVVDYKALVGDSSDNYPGVPGVGPKTATFLLERFGSLDKIYKSLGKISGSVKEKLEKGRESALLSQKLALIVTEVPVKLGLRRCRLADYDQEAVLALFKRLGFKSLMSKLPGAVGKKESGEEEKKSGEQMRLV